MKTTKNKLMINIIIAAKLLLKIPVKAVRLQMPGDCKSRSVKESISMLPLWVLPH